VQFDIEIARLKEELKRPESTKRQENARDLVNQEAKRLRAQQSKAAAKQYVDKV